MIIKKFLAKTEREAIELAKQELGNNAIVMNIKKIHPKGLSKFFVRSQVEVTAALDENLSYEEKKEKKDNIPQYQPDIVKDENELEINPIEEKLNSLQKMIEKQIVEKEETIKNSNDNPKENEGQSEEVVKKAEDKTRACKDLILRQLKEHEVDDEIAFGLVEEIGKSLPKDATVNHILASIYQKIILMLGQPYTIEPKENKTKFVFFLGSTGVGKTTTIAKIASQLKLNEKMKVALVTADTYRIAAVEQLKTYANILGMPLKVIYAPEDLGKMLDELREYDICLVDTAGRSHKNKEQINDIQELLQQVPIAERQSYLVLNAGTKYRDLKEIASTYLEITDYSMIFTKLDETSCNGTMLNLRVLTKRPLSYVTWGQNVPEDIGKVDVQKVAKKLLGGRS